MLSLLVLFLLTPSLLQVVTLNLKMSDYMNFQYLLKQKKNNYLLISSYHLWLAGAILVL